MKNIVIVVSKEAGFRTSGVGKYILSYMPTIEQYNTVEYIFQPNEHGLVSGFLWRIFVLPTILRRKHKDDIKIFYDESFLLSIRSWMRSSSVAIIHHTYRVSPSSVFDYVLYYIGYIGFHYFLGNAGKIVAVSDYTYRDIVSIDPKCKKNTTMIPNSVDIQEIEKISQISHIDFCAQYGLPKEKKILLLIASTETRKNVPTAVSLLGHVSDQYILVRIGKTSPGNQADIIKNIASKIQNIEERYFTFAGISEDELIQFYKQAYCLLCPSFFEGFGRPIIEAQACGLPVISTDRGALLEVIGEYSAIVIKDPTNLDEWKDGLEEINIRKYNFIEKGRINAGRFDIATLKTKWPEVLSSNY